MKYFTKFYLDKEKDIQISLYKSNDDQITYIIETPNHKKGTLITNLAILFNMETIKNEKDMKIITGKIEAYINENNEDIYVFNLCKINIAYIYGDGRIEKRVKIPAIIKTLMSQTKDYKIDINKTLIKSYIPKNTKLRTDLHTHMHATLSPDELIALAIKHQIRYPIYYIKKLNLKINEKQQKNIEKYTEEIAKRYKESPLSEKALERKINDETYINFADLILNNIQYAQENMNKIKNNLSLVKDGQAVFTNLEKIYVNRYIFTKGRESKNKIKISQKKIDKLQDNDIKNIVIEMLNDAEDKRYKNNNLLQDKLLYIARSYKKQGIKYVEIAATTLTKMGQESAEFLQDIHEVLPAIEKETGVMIRFLAALRRVWVTKEETKEPLATLKATAISPYVMGSDIVGEELNDIEELTPVIKQIVEYVCMKDKDYTIRIHAGENDSLKDNMRKAIACIKEWVPNNKKIPKVRIGHGLYGTNLNTEEGLELVKELKQMGVILEFQLSSNIRLNNLMELENHPIKEYLKYGIKCVQGTDGCGLYGSDTIEEQLALYNLLDIEESDFLEMKKVEDNLIEKNIKIFKKKNARLNKLLKDKSIKELILELQQKYLEESKNTKNEYNYIERMESNEALKDRIVKLPEEKMPIIIAGGSFNSKERETVLTESGKNILRELVQRVNNEKVYFVVGHKMQGYEKALLDIAKETNKKIEVNAIIPKQITAETKETLLNNHLDGFCISTESEEFGIYKSFNYEIFERKASVVVAFDGNSPVSNLIQEAKNGKGKAGIYINEDVKILNEKAKFLEGYVTKFKETGSIADNIFKRFPEIERKEKLS